MNIDLHTAARASLERARSALDKGQRVSPLAELIGNHLGSTEPTSIARIAVRDLVSTTATAGGYLVGTSTSPLQRLMDTYSVLREAGPTLISEIKGQLALPIVGTVPTAAWLASEGATIGGADPVFRQAGLVPKWAATKARISRLLLTQADADKVLAPLLGEAVARAIDAAILAGTGVSGQPLGISLTPGITSITGTSMTAANARAMRKAALLSGAREDRLQWIGAPDVQETLGGRETSTTSGRYVWDGDGILGIRAVSTSLCPAGVLILGEFSRVTVATFDDEGVKVEVNPYANFQSGQVDLRLMVPVDLAISPAAAFAVAQAVT